MHTALVLLGGLWLGIVFALAGRAWRGRRGLVVAGRCFVPVWLGLAVVNMWIGVTHAGYTVAEELPIAVPVAIVPIAAMRLLLRRLGAR